MRSPSKAGVLPQESTDVVTEQKIHRKCVYCFQGQFVTGINVVQVDLDDMVCHEDPSGALCAFNHPCRCGSNFNLSEVDLSENADSVVVQCQNCSLAIRVLYTVQPANTS